MLADEMQRRKPRHVGAVLLQMCLVEDEADGLLESRAALLDDGR